MQGVSPLDGVVRVGPAPRPAAILAALLRQVTWHQWRHQPLRHAVAVLAVALGVALAFSALARSA